MNNNIRQVVDNELCFGCGSCNAACPKHAIKIHFSAVGRLLPEVDDSLCVQCGICLKLCPGIDLTESFSKRIDSQLMGVIKELYFAKSNDPILFNNSQSGGSTTEVLAFLFNEGRIDAALVVAQEDLKAVYRIVTNSIDLQTSQSSQYTPIDLLSALPHLLDYKRVAVVGLPCHIEGIIKMREQFPQKYSNIEYLFGLVCAGTQSQLLVDVVKKTGRKKIGIISDNDIIKWRLKKYSNYNKADIAIEGADGKVRLLDSLIRHTTKKFLTSPRCKLCFDKMNLFADVVFGDAWGVSGEDVKQGGNIILCRTEKGRDLIKELFYKKRLSGRHCSMEEVVSGQGIPKKKRMVESALAFYTNRNYRVPGWATGEVFNENSPIPITIEKEMEDYLLREKEPAEKTIEDVSRFVNKELIKKRIKTFVMKLVKR